MKNNIEQFERRLWEWADQVREFKAQIEKIALLSKGDIGRMISIAAQNCDSEKDQLPALLTQTKWNRAKVGRILGVTDGTIRHRTKIYKLDQGDL